MMFQKGTTFAYWSYFAGKEAPKNLLMSGNLRQNDAPRRDLWTSLDLGKTREWLFPQ